MAITFDPDKDAVNRAKHGLSLSLAADMDVEALVEDDRFDYGETRYRAFGFIDGVAHCLVFTLRGEDVWAISLRRAHAKELLRHGLQAEPRDR